MSVNGAQLMFEEISKEILTAETVAEGRQHCHTHNHRVLSPFTTTDSLKSWIDQYIDFLSFSIFIFTVLITR
jgi:hypothetical protein